MNRIIIRKSILGEGIDKIDENILFKSIFRLLENDFGEIDNDIRENQIRMIDEGKIDGNKFCGKYKDQNNDLFKIEVLNGYATIYR